MHDDLRKKLLAGVRDALAAQYPNMLVNYPDREAVDPGSQIEPFCAVTYETMPVQKGLSRNSYKVPGNLRITYFYRPNTGLSGSTVFSDFLTTYFGLKVVNGITFKAVRPYPNAGMKGWSGTLNVIPFYIEYFNVS